MLRFLWALLAHAKYIGLPVLRYRLREIALPCICCKLKAQSGSCGWANMQQLCQQTMMVHWSSQSKELRVLWTGADPDLCLAPKNNPNITTVLLTISLYTPSRFDDFRGRTKWWYQCSFKHFAFFRILAHYLPMLWAAGRAAIRSTHIITAPVTQTRQ